MKTETMVLLAVVGYLLWNKSASANAVATPAITAPPGQNYTPSETAFLSSVLGSDVPDCSTDINSDECKAYYDVEQELLSSWNPNAGN